MKIIQINQNYRIGSTGRIMHEINQLINKSGHIGYMACAYPMGSDSNLFVMQNLPNWFAMRKDLLIARMTGLTGYLAGRRTKRLLKWIDSIHPDIIHLHNIHGDWINLSLLFKYIKEKNISIVWTLHDCWSFTGRCSHFENKGCYKWETGCYDCCDKIVYPTTYFFDFSKKMWKDKSVLFSGLNCAHIVTPSDWLANYVKRSYLGKYNIHTINNGIDLSVFKPVSSQSKYLKGVNGKHIIIGVATSWTPMKGLDDIITLNGIIDKSKYIVVLVGLNKRQMKKIPKDIIGIERTNNINELVELYSSASVFINPTYQDNYPTVNLEAIACGIPVITYNTGGSIESITNETGLVVEKGDVNGIKQAISNLCEHPIDKTKLVKYASANFDKNIKYKDYINLYERILNN